MSIDNAEPPRQPAVVEQPQADVASDDEFREVLFHDIDECRRRYPFAQDSYCGLSSLSMEPTVMVIGDSHSRAYFTALSLYFERRGRAVVWFGIGGCPPFLRVVRPLGDTVIDCNRVTASATDYLSRAPAIDTVILASAFSMYTSGLRENTESSTDGGIELFRRGLNDVVAKVESFGRKVIVLHQVPMLGFDPKLCRSRPLRPATVNPCQERRELSVTKFAEYKAVVSGVLAEHPRAREVDPMDIFCGPTICPAEFGGRVLYFDTNHINVFGSVFFGAAADRRNLFE